MQVRTSAGLALDPGLRDAPEKCPVDHGPIGHAREGESAIHHGDISSHRRCFRQPGQHRRLAVVSVQRSGRLAALETTLRFQPVSTNQAFLSIIPVSSTWDFEFLFRIPPSLSNSRDLAGRRQSFLDRPLESPDCFSSCRSGTSILATQVGRLIWQPC